MAKSNKGRGFGPQTMAINLKTRVQYLAEREAISLSEVERRAGWKRGALFMVLKANNPRLKTLTELAAALNVTVGELIS